MNVAIMEEKEIGLMWGMRKWEDPWSFKGKLDRQKSTVEDVWSSQGEKGGEASGPGAWEESWKSGPVQRQCVLLLSEAH